MKDGAAVMAQWLRVLTALPEVQGSIPSKHMAVHCSSSSRGSDPSHRHIHTHAQHPQKQRE